MRNLIPKSPLILFSLLYAYRLLNAFLVTNLLFPDEWWQFSEPSHVSVYGFGYLTWDWRAGIRSYVTILPMLALMGASRKIGVGEEWIARNGSKVVMAGWLALTDFYTFELAGQLFGPAIKEYALLFSVTSSFHASRSIRSLSNNIEMALSTVALCYLPTNHRGNFKLMLAVVGLACLVRVTTLLFWLTPGLLSLNVVSWRDRLIWTPLIITATILLGLAVDSFFYGKLTVTWWNFYDWNILRGVSGYYGSESPAYHFRVTLPLMVNTSVGYLGVAMWKGAWRKKWLRLTIAGFLGLCSLQTHKETRFLAPIYPVILIFCAFGAQQVDVHVSKKKLWKLLAGMCLIAVICSNVVIGWFYARVHYNGAYEILDKLKEMTDATEKPSVYFLTPCHVLPYAGYLHRQEVKMDFVKCHPEAVDHLMPENESRERDEYRNDQRAFVRGRVIATGYSHLILCEKDLKDISDLFTGKYEECARVVASAIVKRRRGDLLIYCKK